MSRNDYLPPEAKKQLLDFNGLFLKALVGVRAARHDSPVLCCAVLCCALSRPMLLCAMRPCRHPGRAPGVLTARRGGRTRRR